MAGAMTRPGNHALGILLVGVTCVVRSAEVIHVTEEVLYAQATHGEASVPVALMARFNISYEQWFLLESMRCKWGFGDQGMLENKIDPRNCSCTTGVPSEPCQCSNTLTHTYQPGDFNATADLLLDDVTLGYRRGRSRVHVDQDLAAVAVDAHRLDGRNVFVPAGDAVCAAATPYAAADNLTYRWVAYENVGGDPAVFTADTRCTRFDSAHGVVVNLTVANTRGKATAVGNVTSIRRITHTEILPFFGGKAFVGTLVNLALNGSDVDLAYAECAWVVSKITAPGHACATHCVPVAVPGSSCRPNVLFNNTGRYLINVMVRNLFSNKSTSADLQIVSDFHPSAPSKTAAIATPVILALIAGILALVAVGVKTAYAPRTSTEVADFDLMSSARVQLRRSQMSQITLARNGGAQQAGGVSAAVSRSVGAIKRMFLRAPAQFNMQRAYNEL